MLNLFGVKKIKMPVPYYIPETKSEQLLWQCKQMGVPCRIVKKDDPEYQNIKPGLPMPEKTKNPYCGEDIAFVPFLAKDFYERILPFTFDAEYRAYDQKKAKEEWEEAFGKDIPYGEDPDNRESDPEPYDPSQILPVAHTPSVEDYTGADILSR